MLGLGAELRSAGTGGTPVTPRPMDGRHARDYTVVFTSYFAKRLYFFRTSCRRSWGRAITVRSLAPVMVWAATMALTMASSLAWTVARKIGLSCSLASIFR